ncbi:unnamed protein product [Rhizophagus irregularis]|nr:unnamed protein product [Rhizophagus irregularis]
MALDLDVYDEINRLAEILNIERFTNNEIAALFKYFDDDENLSIVKKALIKSKNDEVKLAYLRNVLASGTGLLTERELFRLNFLLPKAYKITTKSTYKSASRKLPKILLLQWKTFLNKALIASSSINNTVKTFNHSRIIQMSPERWGSRDYCLATFGEPDFILFRADNEDKLESINDTEVVVTVEVKPEQLMVDLVEGTEITADGQVKLTNDIEDLSELYNTAVDAMDYGTINYTIHEKIMRIIQQAFGYMVLNRLQYGMITTYARTWFLKRDDPPNINKLYISPMIPINQQHTEHQPSFLECMHYFEKVSSNGLKV